MLTSTTAAAAQAGAAKEKERGMKYKVQLSPTFERIFTEYRSNDERQHGRLLPHAVASLRKELEQLETLHPEWTGVEDYYAYRRMQRR
jgi:hypothetical protein